MSSCLVQGVFARRQPGQAPELCLSEALLRSVRSPLFVVLVVCLARSVLRPFTPLGTSKPVPACVVLARPRPRACCLVSQVADVERVCRQLRPFSILGTHSGRGDPWDILSIPAFQDD